MVVVNVTSVPFCTSVPPASITVAVISAAPLTGTIVVLLKRVTVEPVGAVSGTLSQAAEATAASKPEGDERPPREGGRRRPAEQERGGCYHGSQSANENSVMHLEGQYERRARPDAGYAMAVLLAGIAIMGIVWTLVVPVWKQAVQREKEAELIFRAGQYARAVALYQRKYANAFPPNVDVLLREKFLRKKYKDPVTNGDFRYLSPLELQAQPA